MRSLTIAALATFLLAGCASSVREHLDSRHPSGPEGWEAPPEPRLPYTAAVLRRAERYAPETAADLRAAGELPAPADVATFLCVDAYVDAVMWRDAYRGKISPREVLATAKHEPWHRGLLTSPDGLLDPQFATMVEKQGDDCAMMCGNRTAEREVARRYQHR